VDYIREGKSACLPSQEVHRKYFRIQTQSQGTVNHPRILNAHHQKPTTTMPTPEENVAFMARVVHEVQSQRDHSKINTYFHADLINHTPMPGLPPGREGVHILSSAIEAAFPDGQMKIINSISQGDLVATTKILTGTQQGEVMGLPGDGKKKELLVMDFCRLKEGKIYEHWAVAAPPKEIE
jgi:predicted ester cyclase